MYTVHVHCVHSLVHVISLPLGNCVYLSILNLAGFRGSLRLGSKRGVDINLKELVKTLMLSAAGPQCVSKDLALFQHLISAFYQYEQMVRRLVYRK